ncbi:PGDYG domain-containing protein [Aquibacillus koreensis]|uniref:PGDYG domain-containing protein n=1 Tax=Aquibacillus koreensis TaxID=279446 RepID=A0A9X4AGU9_9BACI|nr:PGDYG domain-containing protein [Aquibacillus koreensis]MCT2536460.1 PGDYG domain-containing protein [Aquibacillus koreensis]MDC3419452.1 PGDYG domain-containing protein [Aquibacillus koreensis]
MPKYRKKPIVVEALKLTRSITIETSDGTKKGLPGDYLITDKNGEQYLCERDTFEADFELVKGQIDLKEMIQKSFRIIKTKIVKHS